MKTFLQGLIVSLCLLLPIKSFAVQSEWVVPALEQVSFFETSSRGGWSRVQNDFDCGGMSAGLFQWNLNSGRLYEVLSSLPEQSVVDSMHNFGATWIAAVRQGKAESLRYIRSLQRYMNNIAYKADISCISKIRSARWTEQGNLFAKELSALLDSPTGRQAQMNAARHYIVMGWDDALSWAAYRRGAAASPTFQEFLAFLDTAVFTEGWWKKIVTFSSVDQERRRKGDDKKVWAEILDTLAAPESYMLQACEAKKNAELWGKRNPTEDELLLLLQSHLIAAHMNSEGGKQFKVNMVSRRGTIVFQDGYVNGVRTGVSYPRGPR